MRIDIISVLDKPVLELALIDAFCDVFFYEGEEVAQNIEQYLTKVDAGENTEDHDIAFFETVLPYINQSLMIYGGKSLNEGIPDVTVGADFSKAKDKTYVGADLLKQSKLAARAKLKKSLTEDEEIELGNMIFEAAKTAVEYSKGKLDKTGTSLMNATTAGITACKKRVRANFVKDTGKGVALEPSK